MDEIWYLILLLYKAVFYFPCSLFFKCLSIIGIKVWNTLQNKKLWKLDFLKNRPTELLKFCTNIIIIILHEQLFAIIFSTRNNRINFAFLIFKKIID